MFKRSAVIAALVGAVLTLTAPTHAASADKQTRLINALERQQHVRIVEHRDFRYTIDNFDGTTTRTPTLTRATAAFCYPDDEMCQDLFRVGWDVRYVEPAALFHSRVAYLQAHLPSCWWDHVAPNCSTHRGVRLSGRLYWAA